MKLFSFTRHKKICIVNIMVKESKFKFYFLHQCTQEDKLGHLSQRKWDRNTYSP